MLIFLIVAILVCLVGPVAIVRGIHHGRKSKPELEPDLLHRHFRSYNYYFTDDKNLGSEAAYRVAQAFRAIPVNYRPFSGNELARTLLALDIKWGDRTRDHAHKIQYFDKEFDDWFWTCECISGWKRINSKHTCKLFDDYGRLVWEFHEITEAAKAQERAFKLDGMVEADPAHLNRLLERARAESSIIKEVTGELLGLPASVDKSEELLSIAQRVRNRVKEFNN